MKIGKRYRLKPRFFIIVFLLLFLIVGGCRAIFSDPKEEKISEEDSLRLQYIQGQKIMAAARAYINNPMLRYDDRYFDDGYPPDDIGVCTDVVWKALLGIDVVIKDLVDEDIERNFAAYEDIIEWRDPSLDFRLVPQLERFLQRNAEVLTTDPDDPDLFAWMPGDIVTFESKHVAIVSSWVNIWGRPYVIQHGKDPAADEDRLCTPDGMKISGHFRWPLKPAVIQ